MYFLFLNPIFLFLTYNLINIKFFIIKVYSLLFRTDLIKLQKVNSSEFTFWRFKIDILFNNKYTLLLDKLIYLFTTYYFSKLYTNVSAWRLQQSKLFIYGDRTSIQLKNCVLTFLYGMFSIYTSLRLWLVALVLGLTFVYTMFLIKTLPFLKLVFTYFLAAALFYLLISGFVFFFKKYQYRYYTVAIQRFWRRTLIIFWAIEACLFVTFFYLTMNANQEPIYMYDNIQFYKTHLFSWRYFFLKIVPMVITIILLYTALIGLNFYTFTTSCTIIISATILILLITWLEFYQFFHLLNFYGNLNWIYDIEEHFWNLESEFKRTRIVNHYTTICLVAKFWHIVFAVIFWVFFVLRSLESNRFRYPLLSANIQNFIIIYIMSWLYMYPWLKYILRKSLDMPYYWFFVNNRRLGIFLFFNDIKLYVLSIWDHFIYFIYHYFDLSDLQKKVFIN